MATSLNCCVWLAVILGTAWAQAPTGAISGVVQDESGAFVPAAPVRLTHVETGLVRSVSTDDTGSYSFPALPAGDYEVRVEVRGFHTLVRKATVETGSTTQADVHLKVGATGEVVTVEGAAALISYDSHKVDGVITREYIEALPLNGRSFLQLAGIMPGVTVTTATLAQYNAQFSVNIMVGGAGRTAINADGGNIRDRTTGNTSQNYSQEVVQEFQLSAVNFDLSTGITSTGSVNIVTRSGGSDYHGAGYFYFRDHNMAGYPALRRDPANPEPFFARRQPGFTLSGPIRKDKAFFFYNYERNNQDGVVTLQPSANVASVAPFQQIAASPYTVNQHSVRFDYRINERHTAFLRYSHDGNRGTGPTAGAFAPSNWLTNTNWSDQAIMGVTSVLKPTLVNDFRYSYSYWRNRNLFPSLADCGSPCFAFDYPQVTISGTNVVLGHTQNATQGRDYRTWHLMDNMTWQKGSHRIRFGGEWEIDFTAGFWGYCDPACVTVWSPERVRALAPGIATPAVIRTIDDLLQLPVLGMTVGYGDPRSPAPYQRDRSTTNHRLRGFFQDSWRLKPRFTLNYGLAYSFETTLANHDIDKPAYLAPIIGGGDNLKPTRRDTNNFSPSLGFAWNVGKDSKTVIRGGGGVYYDTQFLWERLNERQVIGPRGNGRFNIAGAFIGNTIPGIAGVPLGTPLDFQSVPGNFRLGHFMQMIPQLESILGPRFAPTFNDLSIRGLNVFKSASGFATIIPTDYPTMYSMHMNIGVQREIVKDLVVTADLVSRQARKEIFTTTHDHNFWLRPASLGGPVIPACTGTQQFDDRANCSTGVIQVRTPGSRSNYRGLLVRAEKRLSKRYMFGVSYSLQDRVAFGGTISNKYDWFQSYGSTGARQLLNISGLVELPWGFQVSFISQHSGRTPVQPFVGAVDFDGDGTGFELLPNAGYNKFNRGFGKEDLARLVGAFNTAYPNLPNGQRPRTVRNQIIPVLAPPATFDLDDPFSSQDIRLGKKFKLGERFYLSVFGEMFNVLNIANLGGYAYDLTLASFGQPTSRAGQVFGSGGPRAVQFGARFSF